jgi:hypothetical protein
MVEDTINICPECQYHRFCCHLGHVDETFHVIYILVCRPCYEVIRVLNELIW